MSALKLIFVRFFVVWEQEGKSCSTLGRKAVFIKVKSLLQLAPRAAAPVFVIK